MNEAEVRAILARAEAATPGPEVLTLRGVLHWTLTLVPPWAQQFPHGKECARKELPR